MAGTPQKLTATGQAFAAPCVVESILLDAPTDDAKITVYDTADLTANPLASATVVAIVRAPAASTESVYICARCYKGAYIVINSGTGATVIAYIA